MSYWLKNVGTFLERLDDQAERVAEEKEGEENHPDDDAGVASILAARGLSLTAGKEEEDDDDDEDFDDEDAEDAQISTEQVDSTEQQQQSSSELDAPETSVEAASTTNEPDADETNHLSQIPADISENNSNDNASGGGWDEDLTENIAVEEDPTTFVASSSANNGISSNPEETIPPPPEENPASMRAVSSTRSESLPPETTATSATEEHDMTPEHTGTTTESPNTESTTTESINVAVELSPRSAPLAEEATEGAERTSKSVAPVTADAKIPVPPPLPRPPKSLERAQTGPSPQQRQSNTSGSSSSKNTNFSEKQKELRTLRRSVVSLNQQLEAAEAELQAQRQELERAAERMEKDRVRQKEEREKERLRVANEMKTMRQQHEQALKDAKVRADAQMEELRNQLRDVEDKRMQEGGDWNKELRDAVDREKEMAEKCRCAEEEKSTLLNQISILQNQQESLGSRVESLSQTADNAMEREREAEQRLDEALTLHAKQISQRQAREAELERTIRELGEALVKARSQPAPKSENGTGDIEQGRLQSAEHEIESLRNQLQYESQRANSLQAELEDVSKERTQEATVSHQHSRQHERQVAELKHQISQLELDLREYKENPESSKYGGGGGKEDQENLRQIKQLSEEVLRQREKITNSSSEISALKSRLKAATERASKAESALDAAQNGSGDDLERGPSYKGMRRRTRGASPRPQTIRTALQLDTYSQNKSTEQIGKALDGLDAFLIQSGKVLRYQPVARLLFILYLVMIHLWTFFLIFVHAHGYETVHGDFGAGHGIAHGPHALMVNPQAALGVNAAADNVAAAVNPESVQQHN